MSKFINLTKEQVHCLFEMDFLDHDFDLPFGLTVPFIWNPEANYSIISENDKFILTKKGNKIDEIEFHTRPGFYGKKTSDGKNMENIAIYNPDGHAFVVYSNECSYKDKGEDCLFCNINHTKDTYAEKEGNEWKTPIQIGEVVAEAYKSGIARHVTITGGVIPERRELEYYLDAAEQIRKHTGLDDFNGTATVAAPLDFANIDKLKEAGYRTTSMNLEIWDKNIYKTICAGKGDEACGGGHEHWNDAIKHAIEVFGFGNVRSNFVAGLEPKEYLLEGIEYLSSLGVVATALSWIPNIGSKFEGHRTPTAEWHWDVARKSTNILSKNGITYEQLYNATPGNFIIHDLYRVEEELLPIFQEIVA